MEKSLPNGCRNSNVWLPSLSRLRPIRTRFSPTCPRLDENDGKTKDQLYRIHWSEFYEWLFGPEKFRDFRETGPWSHERTHSIIFVLWLLLVFTISVLA